jgi:hypothetical protein
MDSPIIGAGRDELSGIELAKISLMIPATFLLMSLVAVGVTLL